MIYEDPGRKLNMFKTVPVMNLRVKAALSCARSAAVTRSLNVISARVSAARDEYEWLSVLGGDDHEIFGVDVHGAVGGDVESLHQVDDLRAAGLPLAFGEQSCTR
jgi:hypothetical protein